MAASTIGFRLHLVVVVVDVVGAAEVGHLEAVERAPRRPAGAPHGAAGGSEDRAGRAPREEQGAGDDERDPDDEHARLTDEVRETTREPAADHPALVAPEREHQAEGTDHEAGAEGLQVDELAAHEHEPAEAEENERNDVGGSPEGAMEPVGGLLADRPTVPAEPQQGGEEGTDRDHPEPPQFGMVMRSGLRRPRGRAGRSPRLGSRT